MQHVKYFQVAQGVWGMRIRYVNIYMVDNRKGFAKGWVLVDTGPSGSAAKIRAMARSLFGENDIPEAIILTHGHPDHSGAVMALLKRWDVPVYAHSLEIPYLTAQSAYPPPDPTVGHGLMSLMSVIFSKKQVNLGNRIRAIDMTVPLSGLPEWKVIHTPGHTPGHISLFFPLNTTLIAGDAISTTRPESAIAVLTNYKKISGPPMYMTPDWQAAEASVKKLHDLQPRILAPGHGPVMRGRELKEDLDELANRFKEIAVPSSGRYVEQAAGADENGTYYVPPFNVSTQFKAAVVVIGVIAGFLAVKNLNK